MASVVLGAVGALAGGLVGGWGGAQIGWSAGSLVGSVIDQTLLAPKVKSATRGKLDGALAMGSAYGVAIPQYYGPMRTGCNVLWATDLVEHRKHTGGGKGVKRPGTDTYNYTVDALMGLCKGPQGEISKIWAEDLLIWDLTADTPLMPDNITPFLGGEDQVPWSIIEGHLGVGNVPAYKGWCAFGIDDFDLSPWGGHFPAFTALVGPIFLPTNFPGLIAWLDADAIAGLTDGDPVSTWPDQSDEGNDATGTGTSRPTWRTSIKHGHSIVRGTGSTGLIIPTLASPAGSFTAYIAFNPTNISGLVDGWLLRATGTGQLTLTTADDTLGPHSVGWQDGSFHAIAAAATGWQTLSWRLNAGSSAGEAFRNGASLGTGSYTARAINGTPGFMAAGTTPGPTSAVVGDVGCFLLYEGAHTDAQMAHVHTYLNSRYRIY